MIEKGLKQDLKKRQARVIKSLGENMLILPSGGRVYQGSKSYPFKQDSNFFYLTGFPEKDSIAVFDPMHQTERVTLFVKEKIRQEEVWQGFAIGVKKTKQYFVADAVYNVTDLEKVLKQRLPGRTLYYKRNGFHGSVKVVDKAIEHAKAVIADNDDIYSEIHAMRLIKSAWETDQIKKAIKLTSEAQHACMRAVKPGMYEYELEALFEYTCKRNGSPGLGFSTIVAAGGNGTCQHYTANTSKIGQNDLVLIDSGCVWNNYTADVTRTFPASGRFTPIQRDLYEVVLAAQKAGIKGVKIGRTRKELHEIAARKYVEGLKDLKLLFGSTDEIVEKGAYREYWPAGLSHSIGLDVHDVNAPSGYKNRAHDKIQAGMIITVEPGFYSQDFNHMIPEDLRHIGIRIEDDVLVERDRIVNLSKECVKEIRSVEAMVRHG